MFQPRHPVLTQPFMVPEVCARYPCLPCQTVVRLWGRIHTNYGFPVPRTQAVMPTLAVAGSARLGGSTAGRAWSHGRRHGQDDGCHGFVRFHPCAAGPG